MLELLAGENSKSLRCSQGELRVGTRLGADNWRLTLPLPRSEEGRRHREDRQKASLKLILALLSYRHDHKNVLHTMR